MDMVYIDNDGEGRGLSLGLSDGLGTNIFGQWVCVHVNLGSVPECISGQCNCES